MTIEEAIEEIKRTIAWTKAINSAVPDLIKLEGAEEALKVLKSNEYIEISGSRGSGEIIDLLNYVLLSANYIEYLAEMHCDENRSKIEREAQWIQKRIQHYLEEE